MKHLAPYLKHLNGVDNEHLGLADYYSVNKKEKVYASVMSHACLFEAVNDLYVED
jgi:hypothetical protein